MTNNTTESVIKNYQTVTQQFTKYGGVVLFISCLFGTIMNILLFGQQPYRRRTSSRYLLLASLFDFIHLNVGPLSNLLQYGYGYDWTITSKTYCQAKIYFVFVVTAMSATLTSLADLNQFLLSSKKHKRWKFNSGETTRYCIYSTILFWLIISIPVPFCYTRTPHLIDNENLTCRNPLRNAFCFFVQIFHVCSINGFMQPICMAVFGIMTYRNIHQLHRRSLAKSNPLRQMNLQITKMLILQSFKSTVASLPYAVFNCYLLITNRTFKTDLYQAKENLVSQIVYFFFWSNYTSFFVYLFSSSIFQNQWKLLMKRIFCCQIGKRKRQTDYHIQMRQMSTRRSMVHSSMK